MTSHYNKIYISLTLLQCNKQLFHHILESIKGYQHQSNNEIIESVSMNDLQNFDFFVNNHKKWRNLIFLFELRNVKW